MEQANYMPVITDSYDETVKAQSDAYSEIAEMLEESNK